VPDIHHMKTCSCTTSESETTSEWNWKRDGKAAIHGARSGIKVTFALDIGYLGT